MALNRLETYSQAHNAKLKNVQIIYVQNWTAAEL